MKKIMISCIALCLTLCVGCSSEKSETVTSSVSSETAEEEVSETVNEEVSDDVEDTVNINDYLKVVDITADNFDEYFSYGAGPAYDAFGDVQPESCVCYLYSKMFDEGYIIYSADDIQVKTNVLWHSGYALKDYYVEEYTGLIDIPESREASNGEFPMSLQNLCPGEVTGTYFLRITTGKVIPGSVTYLSKEFVDSIDEDSNEHFIIITLKNGEVLRKDKGCLSY